MRLFHISDLHIGKRLGNRDITEELRYLLFECVLGEAYEKYKPDGLMIAGDIYDRSAPSADCVTLFDEFIARAAALRLNVYIVSGNHDSAQRVSYGRSIFQYSGVHISQPFSENSTAYVVESGNIDIALMPFISLEQVKACFPDEKISTMTEATKLALEKSGIPRQGRPCVLVAHQAVGSFGGTADAVGTLEMIDPAVFSDFAYTALGHFHTPMSCGERVRYCGSPFCFSKNEAKKPCKYLDILDIDDSGKVTLEQFELVPRHKSAIIKDSLADILSDKYPAAEDYVYIVITENDEYGNNAERIGKKFPNYVNISYETGSYSAENALAEDMTGKNIERSELGFEELISGFWKMMRGDEISGDTLSLAKDIFEESQAEGTEGLSE